MSSYINFDHMPTLEELDPSLCYTPVRRPLVQMGGAVDGVYTKDGRALILPDLLVKDKFVLINPDESTMPCTAIAVVGKNHGSQPLPVLWDAAIEGVRCSGIDTSRMKAQITVGQNSASYCADLIFENYTYEPVVGDVHAMRFRICDSHDMTFKYSIECALFRYWCSNGCSSVAENLSVHKKHTTKADPEELGAVIAEFPARLQNEADLYSKMVETPVSKVRALDYVRENIAVRTVASGIKVNEKMLERYAEVWNMYKNLGDTGYRLFNVVTHIGTHLESMNADTNMARKKQIMAQQAQEAVQSNAFRKLVGLAA